MHPSKSTQQRRRSTSPHSTFHQRNTSTLKLLNRYEDTHRNCVDRKTLYNFMKTIMIVLTQDLPREERIEQFKQLCGVLLEETDLKEASNCKQASKLLGHSSPSLWLGCRPVDRRVAGSIPDSTNFLTNSSGQATNALVSLFTKQYNWYQLASGLGVRHCEH